jgi:sugar phosphate isomerase/epimerase
MAGSFDRRCFLQLAAAGAALGVTASPRKGLANRWQNEPVGRPDSPGQPTPERPAGGAASQQPLFKISLAEWSLNRSIRAGRLDNLDFPAYAKREFGIDAVEYVNQYFMDKGKDKEYWAALKKRCEENGVRSVLIMCDDRVNLGDPDEARRVLAAETHHQWVEMAKFLGCHSIRVNARSQGTNDEQSERVADGLRRLSEFAKPLEINVIVENHGGLSSNAAWLAATIKKVGLENCGTLPDFGNFSIGRGQEYDRYQGVAELMPLAKGVSAKSYGFDEAGNESRIDYRRMLKIVLDSGYRGYVGIEWEGARLEENEGIRLTQRLLERIRDEMSR